MVDSHLYRRRGIPSRLVIFPDENHWVLNHLNRYVAVHWMGILLTQERLPRSLKWHYEVFRWFDKYLNKD